MSSCSLAQTYSRATGASLNKPNVYLAPYSLPRAKYICIHNSSGNDNKNYSYFQEVIDFLSPIFQNYNIEIIQIGTSGDFPIDGCLHFQGKTSFSQTAFIIKNALLFIGNDSMPAHLSGILNVPSVILYGPTSIKNHGPYWKHDKTKLIESHRNGLEPSFAFVENPKTIDLIKIEEVVSNVLETLDISERTSLKTIYMGKKFNQRVIESVLDSIIPADFIGNAPINIRYDYMPNPQALAQQLSLRKCIVVTSQPIDINILKNFKSQILGIAYEVTEENSPSFIDNVQKIGISTSLFSKMSEENINKYKLDYAEVGLIEHDPIIEKKNFEELNEVDEKYYFKTKKIILSRGKVYPSKSHWLLDVPVQDGQPIGGKVINVDKFYEELDYFYIYSK